ncbi:MAG: phospholipase D-like domain-containing protein [Bdellovibrionales bacterium]|nr:phospholipase D-like domain-containing protein [Bdellovibrionales bacterium]
MDFIFPLVTVRKTGQYDFRNLFWRILESNASEFYVISPFIDSQIFSKIFKTVFSEGTGGRKLIMISRNPDNEMRRNDFKNIQEGLDQNKFRYRLGSGNEVLWYFDKHLHAKVLIADFNTILFGSQNLTYNGLGDDLNKSKCNNELGACINQMNDKQKKGIKLFVESILKDATKEYPL